jgi:glycosyltransferase involved in cell wall biosynthesis
MLGQNETGNEKYILELVRHAPRQAPAHRFFVYVEYPEAVPAQVRAYPNVRVVPLKTHSAAARLAWELSRRAATDALDVLHVSYNAPLQLPPKCGLVVTIHDISFETHPEWFPARLRWFLKASVRRSARAARQIITLSEWCRADLIQTYGLETERVWVTHAAASEAFHPNVPRADLDAIRKKYHTGEHFILAVGNVQPRKNHLRLQQAFALARARGMLSHKLVLAGQAHWRAEAVLEYARALGDAVVWTGYVPDAELPMLYNAAEMFCYPSLFEGFGLPVLEAMACGVPVITSNVTALPEVVGEAAYLTDPYDVEALAQALYVLARDANARDTWRERGLARAKQFSWARMADQTVAVYERAAQHTPQVQIREPLA